MLSQNAPKETMAAFFDDFFSYDSTVWPTDTNDGATGADAQLTTAGGAGGWLSIATAAADNDYHLISSPAFVEFTAGRPVTVEFRLKLTEAAANSADWCVGLTDTVTAGWMADAGGAPPSSFDGFMFFKPAGTAAIKVVSSNGAAQTIAETGETFVSGTVYTLGIVLDPGDGAVGKARFFVNGQSTTGGFVKIAEHRVSLASLAPMSLAMGVKASGAAAETLLVDYVGADVTR